MGKLNNSVKKINVDPTFEVADGEPRFGCCTLCSSRETIRAVLTNDIPLLKKASDELLSVLCGGFHYLIIILILQLVADDEHVHSLFVPRSIGVKMHAVTYAIQTNNTDVLKILLDFIQHNEEGKRAAPTQITLKTMDTGSYNFHTFVHMNILLPSLL